MIWTSGGGRGPAPTRGLPFAGVPTELQERVQEIRDKEPDHSIPSVEFSQTTRNKDLTIRSLLRPYLPRLLLAIGFVTLETIAAQSGPFLTKIGIDEGIRPGNKTVLLQVALAALFAVIGQAIFGWRRIAITIRLGEILSKDTRVKVFSHIQRLPVGFFTKEKTGRLLSRMTSDIDSLTALFQDGLVSIALQVLTMCFVTGMIFYLDPFLALITFILVIPSMTILTIWYHRSSEKAFSQVRDRIADVLSDLQESLTGIRVIIAMNRQKHNILHHRNTVGKYRDTNFRTANINAIYGPSSEMIGITSQTCVLVIGGIMLKNGDLQVGTLTAFILYLTQFFAPIQQLVQLYTVYQQGQASLGKLTELLVTTSDVPEAPNARSLPPVRGDILLDHVTFGYDAATPILSDITLHIQAGETFALVGETGAGKSTVTKLITRFHDPQQGTVQVDGIDLREVTFESLRSQLGVVPQEPFLFHGSIRDNLIFSRSETSQTEIQEACDAVGLNELINRLPHGIDTQVHERGSSLSSGERQLLSLARAFLSKPRVLILDEATSNLDPKTESSIEHALDLLLEDSTAIIIAHRLTTALRADRVAVMHAGRIIEIGTHDSLLAQNGHYASLYRTWISHSDTSPS